MKAKVLLYAATMAILSTACAREAEETSCIETGSKVELVAAWAEDENSSSRTAVQADGTSIWWTTGEEINAFFGTVAAGKFTSTNTEPAESTTFGGTLNVPAGDIGTLAQENTCWAVYPYDAANTCDGESVTLIVSSEQTAAEGTFADKFFPAVAKANTFSLSFWNVCGGARFSTTQEGVQKIIFKSNDGSPMAGKVRVGFGEDEKPQILEILDPVDTVVVNAPNGGFIPGTNYFAAMLPQTHTQGITVSLMKVGCKKVTRTLSSVKAIHRSAFGILNSMDDGITYESFYAVPEIVDLGLSVKWASFNIGASKPEEFGDYFAWGEVMPKINYSWTTYKWSMGNNITLTKYCNKSEYGYNGFVDNNTVLDLEDDVASIAFGNSWRMPTIDDWMELRNNNNCQWSVTTINNVKGVKISSLKSGYKDKWIFLPMCGYYYPNYSEGESIGYYWTSSLWIGSYVNGVLNGIPINAYVGKLVNNSDNYYQHRYPYYIDRSFGASIRPVQDF